MHTATYEQMPWDREHVQAIYPVLQASIIADGQWHGFPPLPYSIGKYRVYNNQRFQAVYAKSENSLFQELSLLPPVDSQDDAGWTIQKLKAGYKIFSVFSLTPAVGNAELYAGIAEWLRRHALILEPHRRDLRGAAYFEELEPGCLLDAMRRLAWLEGVMLEFNQELTSTSRSFWAGIKNISDTSLSTLDQMVDWSEEIVPTPGGYGSFGHKYREPVKRSTR